MGLLALLKNAFLPIRRYKIPVRNTDALTPDELKILEAVKKTREWREGGTTPLCNNINCSTGCNARFRMIIKENLADNEVDKRYIQAIEPILREKVKLFCENRNDFLEWHERSRLEYFCAELDERIPEEALLKNTMQENRKQNNRQREEAWRRQVQEKRAAKKREKQLRHRRRLSLKRERDHHYWVAYWAAKHAIKEEKMNGLRFKKRRKLISVYFFLKNYFHNLFTN